MIIIVIIIMMMIYVLFYPTIKGRLKRCTTRNHTPLV